MDADGSHDPGALPGLIELARGGADLALGSRYVPGGGIVGWHPARRAVSRAGCLYARAVLRVPVRDLTGGLRPGAPARCGRSSPRRCARRATPSRSS